VYTEAMERLRASVRRPAGEARRTVIDRAVGLLAGRLQCRLEEAHRHLLRLAAEQSRGVDDVAVAVIELLEVDAPLGELTNAWGGEPVPRGDAARLLAGSADRPPGRSGADSLAYDLQSRLTTPDGAPVVVLAATSPEGGIRLLGRAGALAGDLPEWWWLPAEVTEEAAAAVRQGQPVWSAAGADPVPSDPALTGASAADPGAPAGPRWPTRAWLPVRSQRGVVALVGLLWPTAYPLDAGARLAVARAAADTRRQLRRLLTAGAAATGGPGWPGSVQEILDVLPGAVALLVPVRDAGGEIVDFVIGAASPEASDVMGRSGAQLVGLRITEAYVTDTEGELWAAYHRVLATGRAEQVGPFAYRAEAEGTVAESRYSVRARRLGGALVITWVHHDDDEVRLAARIEQTERLGNLGWGEWDMLTGRVVWSDQVYRIYERDPALGPLSQDEAQAAALPEDLAVRAAAAEAFVRGESVDYVSRIRVRDRVKYIRTVADAVRDAAGQPLKIYGIVQDVTARETMRARLDEIQQQLVEQERTLQAEHRVASQLQSIILPIPDGPIDLPGLRVGVRYLPAEDLSHVGGDWYHAVALADGSTLLAVGDVAGHGMLAATTMAQVRHGLRGLIVTTTEPAELMARLNQLMVETANDNPAATATAVIARYDPARQLLTWAQAGHPAPLLSRGGVSTPLPRPAGILLGVTTQARYESGTVAFVPGDVLILYTDGLVEHRSRTLDEGMAAVIETIDRTIRNNPDQPLAALLAQLQRANPEDDTCVLAARPLVSPPRNALTGSEVHHG